MQAFHPLVVSERSNKSRIKFSFFLIINADWSVENKKEYDKIKMDPKKKRKKSEKGVKFLKLFNL